MGSLSNEPLSNSFSRGDGIVYFTVNGSFEERFLDPKGFELYPKDTNKTEVAKSVTREGNRIAVQFSRPLVVGDSIGC